MLKTSRGGGKTLSYLLAGVLALATSSVLAADKYWVAPNGTGNWADANWSTSMTGNGTTFDNYATALFHQPINNIDLNGFSPTVYTLRPGGSGFSASNRRVINIYNTNTGAESTFTWQITGHSGNDFKNMVVTFGGEKSTGKVKVYNSKKSATGDSFSLKLAFDGHLVFGANSEYTEWGATNDLIGNNNAASNSVTVAGGKVTMNGGLRLAYYGSGSTGVLQIDSGEMSVAGNIGVGETAKNTGAVVLNGGTLTAKHLKGGAGTRLLTFNGGTLVAKEASSDGLIADTLPVTVGDNGGVIDNGGLDILVSANIGGTGRLAFTGGGTTTLNGEITYSGETAVVPGTILAIANETSMNNILANGLVVAGVPEVGQAILTYTSSLVDSDISKVRCLFAPETSFKISEDGLAIVVDSLGETLGGCWTGAAGDNNLCTAGNWTGNSVPTDSAQIFCLGRTSLVNGGGFAPSSLTFLGGSSSVVIDGDAINNVIEVTNLSSVSHTINAEVHFVGDIKVKQAAMAETGDLTKAHVTFAGGAYAADGYALESGNSAAVYSRCIFGKYFLKSTSTSRWTAQHQSGSKRVCVAEGSYLSVPYAGNVSELYVGIGAKVDIGDMNTSGRPSYQVNGEMIVANITMTGSSGNTFISYNQGTDRPGVYKFEKVTNSKTGGSFAFSDHNTASKHVFYIGSGGMNFSGAVGGTYIIGNNKGGNQYETIRPWYSDFTIADRGNSGAALDLYGKIELCTNDEDGDGRKITIAAKTTAHTYPALIVSGKGEVFVTGTHSGENPTIEVIDTATLSFDEDGSLGSGAITLGAGTTLALAPRGGTYVLANTLNLPTGEGAHATIRLDGKHLRSGKSVFATIGNAATTANVELDKKSSALAGRDGWFEIKDNKLYLNITPNGTILIVR